MTSPAKFKEYTWLISTIDRAGKISLKDLNKRWVDTEMSGGVEMARTTFNRRRDAILHTFGILIECDHQNGYKYYISNKEALKHDKVRNWMLSTLSVSNMLNDSVGMHNRILLEDIPSCDDKLTEIINAMRNNRQITFSYHRYGSEEANESTGSPYCIKLFKRRWYVLVKFEDAPEGKDGLYIYSLDRMENVVMADTEFTLDAEFDAAVYFSDSFGVLVDNEKKAERVVLRAYNWEKYYMRDLPIHKSQREIEDAGEYADFEVQLRPTADFIAQVMSYGKWLKVVSPQWLVDEIQKQIREAMERYDIIEH